MPTDWVICAILWLACGVFSRAEEVLGQCMSSIDKPSLRNVTVCAGNSNRNSWPSVSCQTGRIIIDDVVVGVRHVAKTCDSNCCDPSANDFLNSGKCLMTSVKVGALYRKVLEDLLRECSGNKSCKISGTWTLPVFLGNGNFSAAQYAVVYYMCEDAVPDLDICQNTELPGEKIYLKFKSESITDKDDVDCACDVENTGVKEEAVHITAFDLRLYPPRKPDNCTGASLTIKGKQVNGSQCGALLNTVIWSDSIAPRSSVPLVVHHLNASKPPSFVWLKITGGANSSVVINCRGLGRANPDAASVFLIAIVVTCVTTVAVIIVIVVVCIYRWRHQLKCLHKEKEVEQPMYFEVEPTTVNADTKPPLPPSNSSTILPPPKPLRAHQLPSPTLDDDTAVRRKHYPHTELPPIPNQEEQYDLLLKQRSPTSPGNVYGGLRENGKGDENHYALPGEKHPRGQSVTEDKYDKPDLLKS